MGVRGRRTAVVVLLVAALTAGCSGDDSPPAPNPQATVPASTSESGVPRFEGALEVRVVTGLHVYGRGCRQRSEHDACTADGSTTYTWVGDRSRVTLTSARMHPNAGHDAWVVSLRFAKRDRAVVQRAAGDAGGIGGYALVLDARSGDALQAATPLEVTGGRITVRDLQKPVAWDLVSAYVTAATGR